MPAERNHIAFSVQDMVRNEQMPTRTFSPQPINPMNPPPLSLQQYLDNLEELCQPLDRNILQQCILALAKQVKPEDRRIFLQNFRSFLPGSEHRELAASMVEESFLMNEMESIKRAVENRLRSLKEISSFRDSGEDDLQPANSFHDRKILH